MNLLDLTPAQAERELKLWLAERGEPAYRLRQIFPRLWQRPVATWREATDLPHKLADALEADAPLASPDLATHQVSSDGTEKFLWRLPDGAAVESVLIPEGERRTLCISSQAGCAYGCVFCATGRMGFQRHLAPWEIVAQVRALMLTPTGEPHPLSGDPHPLTPSPVRERGDVGLAQRPEASPFAPLRPTNIVFMGMGEPLHNWAAVDKALTILNDPNGVGIGARHITVSTVGVLPGLEALAKRPEQFRVALSLHAPTSEKRLALMPVEKKYALRSVLKTLERFPKRVTFEYVMIAGHNDTPEDAEALTRIAKPLGALVNLLPLHPGGAPGLTPTPHAEIRGFQRRLREFGVSATVRRSRGLDISAACGQLRVEFERKTRKAPAEPARVPG